MAYGPKKSFNAVLILTIIANIPLFILMLQSPLTGSLGSESALLHSLFIPPILFVASTLTSSNNAKENFAALFAKILFFFLLSYIPLILALKINGNYAQGCVNSSGVLSFLIIFTLHIDDSNF